MHFAAKGHEVMAIDNYLRRDLSRNTDSDPLFAVPSLPERARILEEKTGLKVQTRIMDLGDARLVERLFADFVPETIIHYAEQPSAPYSMRGFGEADLTLRNNLATTHNLIWAVMQFAPKAHIVKLGTMGEYGTPNIDIEEGWLTIQHKGREDKFLYPRQAGSLYHTTKVLDTDLLWFYVRTHGLRVTDLMQGPVYGLETEQTLADPRLRPSFNYDDIFGTVVNRFLVQAVAGVPLTVFGKGGQTRGYLNLLDTLQCVTLAANNPPEAGKLEIYNQFTETFTVNQLAELVCQAGKQLGINVAIKSIANPRKEKEEHYYNPAHSALRDLGLEPHYISAERLGSMMETVLQHKDNIVTRRIMPRVSWS
jgi:UDP-sulfoquinovose synthase